MRKRKYVAAISDTDIIIHLTKAGHLDLLICDCMSGDSFEVIGLLFF